MGDVIVNYRVYVNRNFWKYIYVIFWIDNSWEKHAFQISRFNVTKSITDIPMWQSKLVIEYIHNLRKEESLYLPIQKGTVLKSITDTLMDGSICILEALRGMFT